MTMHRVEANRPVDLLKSTVTVVWVVLIAATIVSWALGTNHGFVDDDTSASVVILVVAFVKVRFIGLYFMELKDAPTPLRLLLEAYCLIVCAVVLVFYFVA